MNFDIYALYEVDKGGIKKIVCTSTSLEEIRKVSPEAGDMLVEPGKLYNSIAINDKLKLIKINLNNVFSNGKNRGKKKKSRSVPIGDISKLKEFSNAN